MVSGSPPLPSLSHLLATVVTTATHRLTEGSRRNARAALQSRYDGHRADREVLAAMRRARPQPATVADRPGA